MNGCGGLLHLLPIHSLEVICDVRRSATAVGIQITRNVSLGSIPSVSPLGFPSGCSAKLGDMMPPPAHHLSFTGCPLDKLESQLWILDGKDGAEPRAGMARDTAGYLTSDV